MLICTVSYTHLDVYKRQLLRCLSSINTAYKIYSCVQSLCNILLCTILLVVGCGTEPTLWSFSINNASNNWVLQSFLSCFKWNLIVFIRNIYVVLNEWKQDWFYTFTVSIPKYSCPNRHWSSFIWRVY